MAIEVRSAVDRFDDLAAVVGTKRPDARGCWCMSYRDSRVEALDRPAHLREECATEPGPGVLAYVDDEVAGWCSVAPRSSYRRLMRSRTLPLLDERDPWSAVCFVVRPPFRRRGLMHTLLAGAVEHAAAHGAAVIEGYPVDVGDGRVDVISGYVGTTAVFEAAGFSRVLETTGHSGGRVRWLMRRELGRARRQAEHAVGPAPPPRTRDSTCPPWHSGPESPRPTARRSPAMTAQDLVVCVPVSTDRQMGHSWGRAARLAVVRVAGGTIADWTEHDVAWDALHDVGTEGSHHARVVRFLLDQQVTTVIAEHMGPPMANTLGKMGIDTHIGVSGDAEAAVRSVAGL